MVEPRRPEQVRAFEESYREVAPSLYAWAALKIRAELRQLLDPEDLCQEVCLRAFLQFDAFDSARASFRTWVFAIARNVLREVLRNLARRERTPGGGLLTTGFAGAIPDSTTSITRRVARDEQIRAFLDQVAALPEEDRRLLIHRGFEGLEHSEVAALLAITTDSATKRWQRLCERLRQGGLPGGIIAA